MPRGRKPLNHYGDFPQIDKQQFDSCDNDEFVDITCPKCKKKYKRTRVQICASLSRKLTKFLCSSCRGKQNQKGT